MQTNGERTQGLTPDTAANEQPTNRVTAADAARLLGLTATCKESESLREAVCMKTYSQDFRERMLAAVDRGVDRAEAVRVFEVSLATLKRWLKRRE